MVPGGVRRQAAGVAPPVLLLHGLAGHAGEWASTGAWLGERFEVVAVDLHGDWAGQVAAARDALVRVGRPAVVVGQSLGGRIAIRLAAACGESVRALVVVEASPSPAPDPEVAARDVEASLRRWPVPFASRGAAEAFFGGPSIAASAWANGLEERHDGLWPRFDLRVMVRALRDGLAESLWPEWERIRCPMLVVRGERGSLSAEEAASMAARGGDVRVAVVADAGHDLHLEQPEAWRRVLSEFLG